MLSPKDALKRYLQAHRDALLWKLDGLGEREVRWPLTDTGTNLLGLVKHVGSMEFGYFGEVFGRPADEPLPWLEPEAEDNADMWATADQSREWVVGFYRRAWAHSDSTIEALDLDAAGRVPWWGPENGDVTLHQIMVHVIAETARHAGHADILRELTDGGAGMRAGSTNLPNHESDWWTHYVARLRRTADEAAERFDAAGPSMSEGGAG
ncbi:DinB family protein [Phytoactinopolyspora alkaliphila]|uniref:DinB family protein n=1 Tax=Phytoactinopolyspora alkaliphila TaxID=1783498 RepID=A0A6N9YSU6_9ACTN|nr:DinB family protein [Phytoactinopolyspora alkaliphila]NED98052.1 DinB family protein [Phytoactinopolyspora alkaliphila]